MKPINVVFVKHANNPQKYLFELPLGEEIKAGWVVMVDTRRGRARASAVSDSFCLLEEQLPHIAKGVGAYLPLARVAGIEVTTTRFLPFGEACHE